MDKWQLNGHDLTQNEKLVFWVIIGIVIFAGLLSLALGVMWIYYSWIKRNNSKNWTGADITKHIFEKTNTNVDIVSAWMYIKYWNYNKKRNTHKLRPWTHNRRSIWTLMEASQQAYATSIRKSKAKTYWMIFRLPSIFKFVGTVLAFILFALGAGKLDTNDTTSNFGAWIWMSLGGTVLILSFAIANVGATWVLWKNVVPMLKDSGLEEKELKGINRIFFWRLIYSIVTTILELIKLVLQVLEKLDRNNILSN